jgi:Leucine-rich repeat (LRR) protein
LPTLPKSLVELYCSKNQLNSLPNLIQLPKLKILYCYYNQLTSLPDLITVKNLQILNCYNNNLILLPELTTLTKLQILNCSNNKITSLPNLTKLKSLKMLYCSHNVLTSLPTLPENLEILNCYNNRLISLPTLPEALNELFYHLNPVHEIVDSDSLFQIKQNIQILNKFTDLYYSLRYKQRFRKWLWEKVREPQIKKIYNPIYLHEHLQEEDDLDTFVSNWYRNNKQ